MYAMSNIALNKNGNDRLVMISTGLFLGLGALMLVKELKDLLKDNQKTRCFDRDEVSRRER
jgi:hypothetical protein